MSNESTMLSFFFPSLIIEEGCERTIGVEADPDHDIFYIVYMI